MKKSFSIDRNAPVTEKIQTLASLCRSLFPQYDRYGNNRLKLSEIKANDDELMFTYETWGGPWEDMEVVKERAKLYSKRKHDRREIH